MANVFISYARDDRPRIQPLVSALESEGLSVWWDPALIPGRRFRQMIAHELATADSVLVIWTRQALESDWVQDEAEEARQRGVLIPVIMEPVTPPAGFRQLQAADLSQWTGRVEHPEFKALIHACRSLVSWAAQERAATPAQAQPPSQTEPLVAAPEPGPAPVVEPEPAPPPKNPDPKPEIVAGASLEPGTRPSPSPLERDPGGTPSPKTDTVAQGPQASAPAPPSETALAGAGFGAGLVRALAPGWVGWAITVGLLALLVVTASHDSDKGIKFSPLALVGPLAGLLSRVIQRRGFPRAAVNSALGGFVLGLIGLLVAVVANPPRFDKPEELTAVVMVGVFFAVAGYTLVGGIALLAASTLAAEGVATPQAPPKPAASAPSVSAAPDLPRPAQSAPAQAGAVAALLRFLADQRNRWILAGAAAMGSIVFFFHIDKGLLALAAAVFSFVTLPAGVMARSMLDRGLPKGPVFAGLTGLAFGFLYAVLVSLGAMTTGLLGLAGVVAVLIVGPVFFFLLFGGVANVIGSFAGRKPPPSAA